MNVKTNAMGIQPLMTRLGTGQANELLREVAVELGLELMMRGRCCAADILAARRAFVVRGRALGLMQVTLAAALGVHRNTISAYCNPKVRERKNLRQRRRKAIAREGRRPSEWNIPTRDYYRHLPSFEFPPCAVQRIINDQTQPLGRADHLANFDGPPQWSLCP
jgi:hypothetical protein